MMPVIGSEKVHSLDFLYVLFPVLTGVVIMLALQHSGIKGIRVNKNDLSEKIGTLSKERIFQVLQGIRLLTEPI